MALLERVTTLIRANLNELIERAEQPETMIRQIILDMENQLIQVKTQVAISIADQHMLEKKLNESRESEQQWLKRAETAIDKNNDSLARAAAERALSYRSISEGFAQQVEDQKMQVETLKSALANLQQKLDEARAKSEVLITEHRRARARAKAAEAKREPGSAVFSRMKHKMERAASAAHAADVMSDEAVDDRFEEFESENEIDRLLRELKQRRKAG